MPGCAPCIAKQRHNTELVPALRLQCVWIRHRGCQPPPHP